MKKRRKRGPATKPSACPCTSGKPYAECCGPLHDGTREPADAVEVMRSRYAAFCLQNADYLWRTLHSQHAARAGGFDRYRESLERSSSSVRHRRLRILDSKAPDADGVAQVLFHAEISQLNRDHSIVELSSFVEEDGAFRYIAGITRPARELAHGLDDLSIDHWDCAGH